MRRKHVYLSIILIVVLIEVFFFVFGQIQEYGSGFMAQILIFTTNILVTLCAFILSIREKH